MRLHNIGAPVTVYTCGSYQRNVFALGHSAFRPVPTFPLCKNRYQILAQLLLEKLMWIYFSKNSQNTIKKHSFARCSHLHRRLSTPIQRQQSVNRPTTFRAPSYILFPTSASLLKSLRCHREEIFTVNELFFSLFPSHQIPHPSARPIAHNLI